jgi:hypothetical protein
MERALMLLHAVAHLARLKIWFPKFRRHHSTVRPIACRKPLLEEMTLHRIARSCQSYLKMLAGSLAITGAQLKFTKGRGIEGIAGKPIKVRNGTDCVEATVRAVALGNGNGTVKLAAPHRGLTTSPQTVANACRPSMGRR